MRSEAWLVRNNHETRIGTAEIKFIRRVVGYMRTGHKRKTEIRLLI